MKPRLTCAFLVAFTLVACTDRTQRTYRNAPVIIISVDTLRADHLPMFGYKAVLTPNIDALRADSTLFTNAYSPVPLTLPSHVAMLTGLLPPHNGVRNNIGYTLGEKIPTLPRLLKRAGYATGAAVSAYVLHGSSGLASSFDAYDEVFPTRADTPIGLLQRSGFDTCDVATRWIDGHSSAPFFYFFHIFEPHSPYEPPEPFRSRYGATYDGEIAAADAVVGKFIEALKASGVYDRAIVVFMSDHGEGLYDHGEPEHGIFLYRESIHVPLMIKLPASHRSAESAAPASLIDVFPTVAQLVGVKPEGPLDGVSLFSRAPARSIYSETLYPRIHLGWSALRSMTGSAFQYIEAPRPELYDIASDPAEKRNVIEKQRPAYFELKKQLDAYRDAVSLPSRIDPEEAQKLAALGYLSSAATTTSGPLPDPKDRISEVAQLMQAARLDHEGRLGEAVTAFRAVLAKNPRFTDAWNQLAHTYEKMGDYENAAEAYRGAIAATPELAADFSLRMAEVLLRMERFEESARYAKLAEHSNPGAAHVFLARIALARKDYAEALREAAVAKNDNTNGLAALVVTAQALAEQGRTAEALKTIEAVDVERSAHKQEIVQGLEFVRGDVLARMGRYDDARAALQREITAFPRDKKAYASLCLVYVLTNRPSDARDALEQMVRANPNRRAMLFAAHTADVLGNRPLGDEWRRRAQTSQTVPPGGTR
jgi:arylsulfatase A-like enzyme/cytochrome c-type biogenesis protein CcmH/NrfG